MHAWAARYRALPEQTAAVFEGVDDEAVRRRPAPGEWSATEVLGHPLARMVVRPEGVARIAGEERPLLPGYD